MHRTLARALVLVAVTAWGGVSPLAAQQQRAGEVLRNAEGEVFDFHPDGAWRVLSRRVAAQRRLLMARGDMRGLNAAMASPSTAPAPAAVTGVRRVPAVLFAFADSARAPNLAAGAGDTSKYRQLLFDATAPTGMGYPTPYSIRSFYFQMSKGLLDLQGQVVGWYTLPSSETNYTGGQNCAGLNPYGHTNCNGIWSGAATTAMRSGLTEALSQADATTNFGLFDNDGIDGNPNSGDDDGVVDMLIFVHSELDGACASATNQHLWSHRSQLPSSGFITNDARAGGGSIRVRDYTLQSGVGGASGCGTSQIMSIGTAAHESGHAFGLPDLYDTGNSSEGIGNWGLMGAGNQTSSASPSRMEAWSLNELGWVTVRELIGNGTYSLGPAPTSDSTFLIRVQGTNTRKEYYLIENRQAVQSDTALIRFMCSRSGLTYPINCHGGLAIWHVDSSKIQASKSVNQMNAGTIHGLALVQADNLGQLDMSGGAGNRGNAGDVWPGYGAGTPKTRYSFDTSPSAKKNLDSTFVGFEISNITQIAPEGAMSFQLTFGAPAVVQAVDTVAKIKVDGITYGRYNLFGDGAIHSISMDSAQTTPDGRTQFLWQSWSDAGARTHSVTFPITGAAYTSTFSRKYKIQATAQGTGTVASAPSVDYANGGAFADSNSSASLMATASGSAIFDRWTGDTNATSNPLVLSGIRKPYLVTAVFAAVLAQNSGTPPGPVMGASYAFNLSASGGTGTYTWSQTGGALPMGMSLSAAGAITGVPESAGPFSVNVRVTSGTQTADGTVSFTVTEPTLVLANVLSGLLGTGGTLSASDQTYLDLIGNRNNGYDVGDYLAWVDKTGATPPSMPLTAVIPRERAIEQPVEEPWERQEEDPR